jgi:hypothetical protein
LSTVYLGNAVCDENGKAKGGKPGNQTGKELRIQPWYLNKRGWIVLRPKDSNVATKLAKDMRSACENMHIGYNQSTRNTLYTYASKVGFDCAKVTTDCECDCSSLVRVCCLYAGVNVKNFSTASELSILMKTGMFDELTEDKYTTKSDYLKAGDILVTQVKGHTAIVLNNGDKADPSPKPPSPSPSPTTDAYVLVTGSVRVRITPKTGKPIYTAHSGDKLPYLGETAKASDGGEWYYVRVPNGDEGYISAFTNSKRKYTKLVEL